MPEFEPDNESVSRAEKLSSRLMDDLHRISEEGPLSDISREMFSNQQYSDETEGVPISDVVTNVAQMASEFAMARLWDGNVACLKLNNGDLAPISMTEFFGANYGSSVWIEFWERYGLFPPRKFLRDVLRRSKAGMEEVVLTDVREATDAAGRNLTSFLSYRFTGIKHWREWIEGIGPHLFGGSKGPTLSAGLGSGNPPPPPGVASGGGLQVQVSCLTPGLRIHVSPAYFITWVFFGSPTTPVISYLLPGRYVFAGDGPMLPKLTKDHAVFCIPPTYQPTLTGF